MNSVYTIIIERDERVIANAEEQGFLRVHGDSTIDVNLEAAQVREAACLIAATGDDSRNVYISLSARTLNPNLHIVARASRADAEERLLRGGGRSDNAPCHSWASDGAHGNGESPLILVFGSPFPPVEFEVEALTVCSS